MKTISEYFGEYQLLHRTRGNLICHSFGIPLIVFSSVYLLAKIPVGFGGLTLAEPVIIIVGLYCGSLDVKLGSLFFATLVACDFISRMYSGISLGVSFFLIGWAFQGVGHIVFEKKSAAFQDNLVHLLIGPLFLIHKALSSLEKPSAR